MCTFCVLLRVCACECVWMLPLYLHTHACFVFFRASNTETHFHRHSHYHHVRLTFWLLSGIISKVIILWLPPYYLPSKAPLQHNTQIRCLGLSGRWAFDWQLVNDVISVLLGKWGSGNSRLVCEGGRQFVTADALSVMDGGATPARRNCPTVLFEERLRGRRVRMK